MEIFPETLGPELDIPNCGFTFATGTYLTGVTEIHSEGSRFGRPSTKGLHHEEGIHSLVKAPQGNDSWQRIARIMGIQRRIDGQNALVVHLSLCHADILFVGNPSENANRH